MSWPDGITDAMVLNLGKLWEMLRDEETWTAASLWGHKELDMAG